MIPKKVANNILESNGIKYIPVKELRNSISKDKLNKFADWFFGRPIVIGKNKECGVPLNDLETFFK